MRTRILLATAVVGASALTCTLAAPATARPSGPSGASGTAGGQALAAIQADGAAAIAVRESQLSTLASVLSSATTCDSGGKIAAVIAADAPALQTLGQKLAADTTLAQARLDHQAIFDQYRVYLVVTPQAFVSAACGHVQRAAASLTTDQQKLASRVSAAAAAGADMSSAQAALNDMSSRLRDAQTRADAAYTTLSTIVPDQRIASVEASNAAAVAAAHADLATARADLVAAVSDARTDVAALKAAGATPGTTTTTA